MRCLTLAHALSDKGADVTFICRNLEGNLVEKIRQEGFETFLLVLASPFDGKANLKKEPRLFHSEWLEATQLEDVDECTPILKKIQPDWLIVDHYSIDQFWQMRLAPFCRKLMVIDDLADRQHVCDLLLDQNFGSTVDKYKMRVQRNCKVLAGSHYALLRPEFANWRSYSLARRQPDNRVETILISMGGVDPDNYTGRILQQLMELDFEPCVKITVVMGATAPHTANVKKLAQQMAVNTTVNTNVGNMAELMANSDLAIGAAGATSWERCCLGLPTIQLVIAENQRQIARALSEANAIMLLDSLADLPESVVTAEQWCPGVVNSAQSVTDGLGVNRVVDAIQSI